MKVTLRKANALQQSILDTIKSNHLNNMVSFNEFENVAEKFDKANKDYFTAFETNNDLNVSLYTIRKLIGKANANQINDLLSDVALLEKTIQLHQQVANSAPATAINIVEGKLDKIKNNTDSTSRIYGRADEVSTTVCTENNISTAKLNVSTFKKEKQKLQDKILELNIKTEIELPDTVVETLTKAGIL